MPSTDGGRGTSALKQKLPPTDQVCLCIRTYVVVYLSVAILWYHTHAHMYCTYDVYCCHVTVVPVAPVSVTVDMSTVTPESALVTWTPLTDEYTGGFNLVRYIVSYKQDNDEESVATRLEVEPEASQIVLEGLEPLATYTASVQGVNALGEGFPAVSQAFTTPELSE